MNKNRLENFSDGVFAIAVTLLILNVRFPNTKYVSNQHLNDLLIGIVPHLLTFAFSFLVIGVFWISHHRIFSFVRILDSTLLWLNILYLLFIAIIPLTAAILSENPFLPTAILLYTITLLIIALMHFILLEYILRNKVLKHEALTRDIYKSARQQLPDAEIYWLSMKQSPVRAKYYSEVILGNQLVKTFISNRSKTYYVDFNTPIIDKKTSLPDSSLFKPDYLHLNNKGYDKW
jgi:uncharacterized membrane protein